MAADEMNEWDSFVWWCNEKELNIDKYAMTMVWEYMQSMVAQERSRIATGVKSLLSAGDSSDLVWRHDVLSIIDKP